MSRKITYTITAAISVIAICSFALTNAGAGANFFKNLKIETASAYTSVSKSLPREVKALDWTEEELAEASPLLIKMICHEANDLNDKCRKVYFLNKNGFIQAFPNERVFYSWYNEFRNVHLVTEDQLSAFPSGNNVTYHPGAKLVKFPSDPTVYAVARFGVLRPIANEQVAREMRGYYWQRYIDDISEVFYFDYTFGEPINDASEFDEDAEYDSVQSINDNLAGNN